MRFYFTIFIVILLSMPGAFAQSRRVNPNKPAADPAAAAIAAETRDLTAEQMYTEASLYAMNKYAEYEKKKIAYNKLLHEKTQRDQRQLAAKYAAVLAGRENLGPEDVYYLGMLNWVAENIDNADETMRRYLAAEDRPADKAQTARSVLVMTSARRKNLDEAEKILAEYLKSEPVRMRETARMHEELANVYRAENRLEPAAAHAEKSYLASKKSFEDASSRVRALNDVLNAGMRVFEIYREAGGREKADRVLDDLRRTGAAADSFGIYYQSVDQRIKYMIETNRKPDALMFFEKTLKDIPNEFKNKRTAAELVRNLKKRKKHYEVLGSPAPELEKIDRWFPGTPQTLAALRGRVVLLDFWATWCLPCLGQFPALIGWNETYKKDGLEILGITRYYGEQQGFPVDEANEIEFLKKFRVGQNLPYDIVVGKDVSNQIRYGATSLPTTVIIDRQGVVRYIESGSSNEEEVEAMIVKLLAEK